jgi:hypothetical protein
MPARPPAQRRRRRRKKRLTAARRDRDERKREADAKRQRDRRARESEGVVTFRGRCSQAVIDAMVARNRFLGMSQEEAERDANDPKEIAALAFDVLDHWAPVWYEREK